MSSEDQLLTLTEFKEDLNRISSDPLGQLWVGMLGLEGSSTLLIGDVDPAGPAVRVLETVDLKHGFLSAEVSLDGTHLGTVNADGTYTLFDGQSALINPSRGGRMRLH